MQSLSKGLVVFFRWLTKINSPGIAAPGCPRVLGAGQTSGFAPTAGMVWQEFSSHLQRGPRKPVFNHTIPLGTESEKRAETSSAVWGDWCKGVMIETEGELFTGSASFQPSHMSPLQCHRLCPPAAEACCAFSSSSAGCHSYRQPSPAVGVNCFSS